MMPNSRLMIFTLAGLLFIILTAGGCQNSAGLDPDQQTITDKTYELFTRVKVRDKAVIYENEFPYVKEERDLEEYLNSRFVKGYNADTLVALQVDSVEVLEGDSALAFVRLEFVQADSTLKIQDLRLLWRKMDEVWIKPSLSSLERQLEFEEELRIYWDAVREMENKDTGDTQQEDDSQ